MHEEEDIWESEKLGGLYDRIKICITLSLFWFPVEYGVWCIQYFEWCRLMNHAKIRWVKVEALRRWRATLQPIPRMQDLEPGDHVDFACGTWRQDRRRFVCSHTWLAPGEPDPNMEPLGDLVSELDRLEAPDSDVVFYDHASFPQPPKTEDEKRRFDIALNCMNLMYTLEGSASAG